MEAKNPDYANKVRQLFERANFVNDVGIRLERIQPGEVETILALLPRHAQQDGVVHAGVLATLADHTAGGAAMTLLAPNETILSIEFKLNLLRPAKGERLRCIAMPLRHGRTVSVVEAEVFAVNGTEQKLVSKATVTLAVVSADQLAEGKGR
ncbi:MAG: PaaI family thioesterase [Myxococcaceae bacterium]